MYSIPRRETEEQRRRRRKRRNRPLAYFDLGHLKVLIRDCLVGMAGSKDSLGQEDLKKT